MDDLLKILKEVKKNVNYFECTDLMTGGVYDSLDILQLIDVLEEKYNVVIMPEDITPQNFDSVNLIFDMINRLKGEK